MSRFIAVSSMLFLVMSVARVMHAEELEVARIGKQVADFSLQDFRGKKHSLDDYREAKLVVIAFLGTECPLAKLYGPRLQRLADR